MRLIGLTIGLLCTAAAAGGSPAGEAALGTRSYDEYEKPAVCAACHVDIHQQWAQSMMAQAYTHHWDEIEYFELAVPHAEKDAKVAGVKAGCNGCHAPLSFLAGDVPPPPPGSGSRADEGVSCDLCHTITGFEGETPYNFNWISEPGRLKQGPKPGLVSPHHDTVENPFLRSADFCGTCHNEMSPYGIWVKSTHLEWSEGPYAEQGVPCQDCHMPEAWGRNAKMSEEGMIAQHLFHGAHDEGKLRGSVEMRMHAVESEVEIDGTAQVKVQLFNGKCGHKVPSGSVEDRIMWLTVTAEDSEGLTWHLPVDPKGFEGEETTIAADVAAYQDLGIALEMPDFPGIGRDGIGSDGLTVGDRIFRMAYHDPQGRMTIQQWNTASLGPDYRIGPRETKVESFSFEMPEDVAPGPVTVRAELKYKRLVQPVADFMNVPEDETVPVVINTASTVFEVYE